uniref:Uncharacterized protein n=1 Tax=Rhizophora mucronata TaxID=61149 RepID=A0A2P2J580_RHIMU
MTESATFHQPVCTTYMASQ